MPIDLEKFKKYEFVSPLHKMLVKEINNDLAWLANERERLGFAG